MKLGRRLMLMVFAAMSLIFPQPLRAQEIAGLDPGLSSYKSVYNISGNLNCIGSDTLNNLMTLWGEKFSRIYPSVKIQIEGRGSGTAPPALIDGTAQFGPMSREMKASEIDAFEKKFLYPPTLFRIAVDALTVFVNKDNPLTGLSLAQLDAMFSSTRRRGLAQSLDLWGQVGLGEPWQRKTISLYGRNSASGTYGFFKEQVLENGDFRNAVKEQPGSASVIQGVAVDRYGIGYSGIGYQTSGVRVLPLARSLGDNFVHPSQENTFSGQYPLARFLYIYVNKAPGRTLAPMAAEFIRFIFSREGQEEVLKEGFYPVTPDVAREELGKL